MMGRSQRDEARTGVNQCGRQERLRHGSRQSSSATGTVGDVDAPRRPWCLSHTCMRGRIGPCAMQLGVSSSLCRVHVYYMGSGVAGPGVG